MKISKLIEELEFLREKEGDLECLIEINSDGFNYFMPVDFLKVSVEKGFGKSVTFRE